MASKKNIPKPMATPKKLTNTKKTKIAAPRTSVDDPQNDIFYDEIFNEEIIEEDDLLPKTKPKAEEENKSFDKPW